MPTATRVTTAAVLSAARKRWPDDVFLRVSVYVVPDGKRAIHYLDGSRLYKDMQADTLAELLAKIEDAT